MIIPLTFGDCLAMIRNSMKLTQKEFAEKLGTYQQMISYWETKRMPMDRFERVVILLGLSDQEKRFFKSLAGV